MMILGLAGHAGVGKDVIADYLVQRYGFVKFAFSDALYWEVQQAYGLPDQMLLRDRETKEKLTEQLCGDNCNDYRFINVLKGFIDSGGTSLSPRQVLQWWGTEYRRAQQEDYWIKQAEEFVLAASQVHKYPEHRPQHFVNTAVRFSNEQAWVHAWGGNVWHVRRDLVQAVSDHVSEERLPVLENEREIWNNDSIDRLHTGIDILLSTSARFVRVEPMEPDVPPEEENV